MVSRLTPIRIKNNFLLASASPFTFRTTPISNSTMPSTVLPTLIDSVASIYSSFVLPPVKVMTSFDENMLKQPPNSEPLIPLKTKQAGTLGSMRQKMMKVPLSKIQQQKRVNLLKCFFKLELLTVCGLSDCSQKWPRRKEPSRVPTLKAMGMVDLQSLKPTLLRQVGIHKRKPQRIHFSSEKPIRYNLLESGFTNYLENYKNSLNFDLLSSALPYSFVLTSFSSKVQSAISTYCVPYAGSLYLLLTCTKANTTKAINMLNAPDIITDISHLQPMLSTSTPVRPKPIISPKSPVADHIPKALPSFFILKREFVSERRVGHAPNWQKPKSNSPKAGRMYFNIFSFCTFSPAIREMTGMTRQPIEAIIMQITYV